jgi:hypothetical protein
MVVCLSDFSFPDAFSDLLGSVGFKTGLRLLRQSFWGCSLIHSNPLWLNSDYMAQKSLWLLWSFARVCWYVNQSVLAIGSFIVLSLCDWLFGLIGYYIGGWNDWLEKVVLLLVYCRELLVLGSVSCWWSIHLPNRRLLINVCYDLLKVRSVSIW